jgi:hypothetical protein
MRLDAFVSDERGARQTMVIGDDGGTVVAGGRLELGL